MSDALLTLTGRYSFQLGQSRGNAIAVSFFQLLNCVMITIAYTIVRCIPMLTFSFCFLLMSKLNSTYMQTGVTAMFKIAELACSSDASSTCWGNTWKFTLIFGAVEVFLSQVRNLEEAWWVSAVGSVASIMYSTIALVISLAQSGHRLGTVGGITASSAGKAFGVLDALGSIAFAYSFSLILLEVEASLKQPPRAAPQMRVACYISITASFAFYISVAVAGYLAKGNLVSGMILASYNSPKWALYWANSAVLIHMITAYQVFGQPVFDTIESHYKWWVLRIRRKREEKMARMDGVDGATPTVSVSARTNEEPAPPPPSGAVAEKAELKHKPPVSPFDVPAQPVTSNQDIHRRHSGGRLGLDRISMPSLEQRLSTVGSGLGSIDERAQSTGQVHMEARGSSLDIFSPRLSRISRSTELISNRLSRLSQAAAMYHVDTGFANEDVPLNDDHYFVPLTARIVLRTLYVGIITLIAIIMPFFSAFVGLIGALTFFPLAVYFPIACYRKVYPVSRRFGILLSGIWWSMLFVCGAATIAAVRDIITGWNGYKIFGN